MASRLAVPTVAAAVVVLLGRGRAAGEAPGAPLTPDQQEVVVAVVNDTFPLRRPPALLVLCLDAQNSPVLIDDVPPRARGPKQARSRRPQPRPPAVRGVPQQVVERLTRPWRKVISARSCRLPPGQAVTLNDDEQTPAQLVTVRMSGATATGAVRIEWTAGPAGGSAGTSSRDCSAVHGNRGWVVRCGGTWSE